MQNYIEKLKELSEVGLPKVEALKAEALRIDEKKADDKKADTKKVNITKAREKALAEVFKALASLPSPDTSHTPTDSDRPSEQPLVAVSAKPREVAPPILEETDDPFEFYASYYGDWVRNIPRWYASKDPSKKKKCKKRLADLARLIYLNNCINTESPKELLQRIQHAKQLSDFEDLENKLVIQRTKIPSLRERLDAACEREKVLEADKSTWTARIEDALKEKRQYLENKKKADAVATVLTAIVSSLGVGLTAGIAMLLILPLIWPALPLGVLITSLIGFTVFGSVTEFFVYRSHVKKFCRQCVRGFFESIDNRILNREAKLLKGEHADKYDLFEGNLSEKEKEKKKEEILTSTPKIIAERIAKRILILLCIPVALGAGVGFMGLVFSQVVSMLLFFCNITGVVIGGAALFAAPWALAVLVGPLYAIVMYGMLYKAVKNNIFGQMWDHITKALAFKAPKDWDKLKWYWQLAHIAAYVGKCLLMIAGVLAVLGLSFCATVFTAGALLESSISFFTIGLTVAETIANGIGYAVGLIFLAINFCFSTEKCLQSASSLVDTFRHLTGASIVEWFKDLFYDPKTFFKKFFIGLFNSVFVLMHFAGIAAVATLGTELAFLKNLVKALLKTVSDIPGKIAAALLEGGEEVLTDIGDVGLHALSAKHHAHPTFPHLPQYLHQHKHQHGHEHGNPYKILKWLFFSKPSVPEAPERVLVPAPRRMMGGRA